MKSPPELLAETAAAQTPWQEAADTIRRENRRAALDTVRALWRIGDLIQALRAIAPSGEWRSRIHALAAEVGCHPASLDAAARAAAAFMPEERAALLSRFENAKVPLTTTHVLLLARAAPAKRRRAIEDLLKEPCSTRALRERLRVRCHD